MLISAGVLQGMQDNPSDEEKEIWSAGNAPIFNQFRQAMSSVIFTIPSPHSFNRSMGRRIH